MGHTDRVGAAAANATLSLKRAQTTLKRLTEAGITEFVDNLVPEAVRALGGASERATR